MRVGRNQIQSARKADLYEYLLCYHSDTVQKCGHNRLQNNEHDSLIITRGKGYVHNSINQSGNAIDYLTKYLGYDFTRAVAILSHFEGVSINSEEELPSTMPKAYNGNFRRIFGYLNKTRGIPNNTIQELVNDKLLYEDERHNCVFCSVDCTYSEIVGTLSEIRFKGIPKNSDSDGYWKFGAEFPERLYICESAIDAISLAVIQSKIKSVPGVAWVSIGGLKPAAINRLIATYDESRCVLAIDNDDAGDKMAAAFNQLRRIKPKGKDWNEDLLTEQEKKTD